VAPTAVPGDPYTQPPLLSSPSSSSSHHHPLTPGPEDTGPGNARQLRPEAPAAFAAAQRELAQDLVLKGAQMEHLASVLPGLGRRQEEQEERIRVLERELRSVDQLRRDKRAEMRALVAGLEEVVMGVAETRPHEGSDSR
jgi:mediator of RNA polymerase II transcription subunit 21